LVWLLARIDPPIVCRIVRRLNRFVVLVSVDGKLVKAYLNNTGRLRDYLIEGRLAYASTAPPNRRTTYNLFAIDEDGLAALIDTRLQTVFFEEALNRGLIPWLSGFRIVKRNVRLYSSLIDYLLKLEEKDVYMEVKSAVMRIDRSVASYPDCPSIRGRKHVEDLISASSRGLNCVILFLASLPYVDTFKPNSSVDPKLTDLLKLAIRAGVLVKAVSMYYDPSDSSIYLDNPELRVEL